VYSWQEASGKGVSQFNCQIFFSHEHPGWWDLVGVDSADGPVTYIATILVLEWCRIESCNEALIGKFEWEWVIVGPKNEAEKDLEDLESG
jgi:hypothetical protein